MTEICGQCANYWARPFNENVCILTGKVVPHLARKECFIPRDNTTNQIKENTMEKTTKVCKECGRELPIEQFRVNPKSADGHLHTCYDCMKKKAKAKADAETEELVEKIFGKKNSMDGITTELEERNYDIKPFSPKLSSFEDVELVEELRLRGWDVKCSRTIEL